MKRSVVVMALGLAAQAGGPALAADLFEASGAWVGEGRLATGVAAPLERGRCRVEVTPAPEAGAVDLVGTCAVAAGLSDISLKLVRGAGDRINAGAWSAATGAVVQYAGVETAEGIALAATTPLVVDGTRYETRVDVTRPDADSFAVRQLLRAEGDDAWRLVAEMTYRPAGG